MQQTHCLDLANKEHNTVVLAISSEGEMPLTAVPAQYVSPAESDSEAWDQDIEPICGIRPNAQLQKWLCHKLTPFVNIVHQRELDMDTAKYLPCAPSQLTVNPDPVWWTGAHYQTQTLNYSSYHKLSS